MTRPEPTMYSTVGKSWEPFLLRSGTRKNAHFHPVYLKPLEVLVTAKRQDKIKTNPYWKGRNKSVSIWRCFDSVIS